MNSTLTPHTPSHIYSSEKRIGVEWKILMWRTGYWGRRKSSGNTRTKIFTLYRYISTRLFLRVGFAHLHVYTCIHIHALNNLEPVKSPSREDLQGNQFIDTAKIHMKGSRKSLKHGRYSSHVKMNCGTETGQGMHALSKALKAKVVPVFTQRQTSREQTITEGWTVHWL